MEQVQFHADFRGEWGKDAFADSGGESFGEGDDDEAEEGEAKGGVAENVDGFQQRRGSVKAFMLPETDQCTDGPCGAEAANCANEDDYYSPEQHIRRIYKWRVRESREV